MISIGTLAGAGAFRRALSAVWRGVCGLVSALFEGFSICLANPVVFLVIALTFGGGVWAGIDWNRHTVEVANAKVASLKKQWKDADADAERRLATALAAREAATLAAKENEDRAARAAADAARLRARLAKQPAPAPSGGSSVPWLSTVLGGDGAAAAKR